MMATFFAGYIAQLSANGIGIQQGLGGVLMGAIAGVNDVGADVT